MNKKNFIIKYNLFKIKKFNRCKIINFQLNTPLNIFFNNLFLSTKTGDNNVYLYSLDDNSENQKWSIEKYKNNSYYIKLHSTNKYLGSINFNTYILLDNKNDASLWYINNELNDIYAIGILNNNKNYDLLKINDNNYDLFKINNENNLKIETFHTPSRIISVNNNYLSFDISENKVYYDITKLEDTNQFWIIEKISQSCFYSIKNIYNNKFLGSDTNFEPTFYDSLNSMTNFKIKTINDSLYKVKFTNQSLIVIIRGHIRDSFKTHKLYNFINNIYNLNSNLKIYIHTWNIFLII